MTHKVVVVTGAASGIGAACARRFAQDGDTVVVADREDTGEIAEQIKPHAHQCMAVHVDVSDEHSVSKLFESTLQRFGRIDVLAHLAGVSRRGVMTDVTVDEWQHVIDINLKGTFLVCRAAVVAMRSSGGGAIVTTGSELAHVAARRSGLAALGAAILRDRCSQRRQLFDRQRNRAIDSLQD